MYKIRFVFEKGEALRYLGHLDLLRTFIRGLRRAEVPVKYSKGFNPHAVLSFALPTGVGVTSECELADVEVTEKLDIKKAISDINANMPSGSIRIITGKYASGRMPVIERARYSIDINSACSISADEIKSALAFNEILIEKKSKKKTTRINIIKHIFDYEVLSLSERRVMLSATISAGSTMNIKPQLVVEALNSVIPNLNITYCLYHRKAFEFAD